MANLEIEIKSLLGEKEPAARLRQELLRRGATLRGNGRQLNHYFTGGDVTMLPDALRSVLSPDALDRVRLAALKGKSHSIRTREADGDVFFVIKASIGDDSSANGVSRMEVEEKISTTLEDLDALLLNAGFSYQAKWSRAREEYQHGDMIITIDRNAGYGYVAEFERVVPEGVDHTEIERAVRALMHDLGVEELSQERLERMFAYYNAHWPQYYGTDRVFVID